MTYEELKNSIVDKLTSIGFKQEEDKLTKINIHQHQVVINGQAGVHEDKQSVSFTVVGEGAIGDDVAVQLSLTINNQNVCEFLITDLKDLEFYFNIV